MRTSSGVAAPSPGLLGTVRALVTRTLAAVDEVVDYRALVPLRMVAGLLTLVHLGPFLAEASTGITPAGGFVVPYSAWYPTLPDPLYVAALGLAAAGAVLIALGLFTRVTTAYTAAFVVYNLFLSRTHYHHNRAFLAVLLVGLALVPVGNAISLDALRMRRRGRPPSPTGLRWPLMLLRFQVAAVYAASGISKLLDADWFGGIVTRLRVARQVEVAVAAGVPRWIVDLVATQEFHAVFAKLVVVTEIFIGLGLLVPRVRTAAIWVAIPFHFAIAVTADVEVFSWAALAALTIWVTPRSADRVVFLGGSGQVTERWAAVVRALDWTGRFRVRTESGASASIVLHERDGAVHTGRRAVLGVAALLPATFFVAAPLELAARRGVHFRQGSTSRRTG